MAADVAEKRQDMFTGLILISAGLDVDPQPGRFWVGVLNNEASLLL